MGNIGEPLREIEFEPIEEPASVPEPERETPAPHVPEPEKVPA